tara:strand:- start:2 stop:1081 length:1080 start_codon:yes stop_codon:yes gene_type:complete
MIFNNKFLQLKILYIFFLFLSLNLFFFSTNNSEAKAFQIEDIDISRPFLINFDKNDVIDEGFKKAFSKLISMLANSSDRKKINRTNLNEIKGMIESFSIKEEKFVNEIYYMNLGVSFNKKKIFNFFEKRNIFPSIPIKKVFLFIPIIIDESTKDLLIFSDNKVFENWNNSPKNFHLIDYILPTEDLEDLNIIKSKFESIEKYDFKEIIDKYNLNDSIITLIFKNKNQLRILSRITLQENITLKNLTLSNINMKNEEDIKSIIKTLKNEYEDYWKLTNQINTSLKYPLKIKVQNIDNNKISKFEEILINEDLIYDFYISKFDKDFSYYNIIYNGTPNIFIKSMNENNFNLNTQNKIWLLE